MKPIKMDISTLQEAGFSSWMAFYCAIHTTSLSEFPVTYGYEHPQNGKGTITLEVFPRMLHALAMEDGKNLLKKIKADSFAALMDGLQQERGDRDGWYHRDLVIRTVTGDIRYERIVFNIVDVHKMLHLENTVGEYSVFEEEEKTKNYVKI
jgi:hypothetical protein